MLLAGITSSSLCYDHTFATAAAVKFKDKTVNRRFSPAPSIFGVLSAEGQVCALNFTRTVNCEERRALGMSLAKRYEERGLDWPICFGDNCCADAEWLASAMDGVSINIDPHHLIKRYTSVLPKDQLPTASCFVKDLTAILMKSTDYKVGWFSFS